MSPAMEKMVKTPLDVVDELFAKAAAAKGDVETLKEEGARDSWGAKKVMSGEALFAEETLREIPWLTRASLRAGHLRFGMLVRYRAMVQDTFDPEYYDCIVRTPGQAQPKTLKYREYDPEAAARSDTPSAMDTAGLSERLPLYCVPVPGETAWAREARIESGPSGGSSAMEEASQPSARTHRKRVALDGPARDGDASADKRPHLRDQMDETDAENAQDVNNAPAEASMAGGLALARELDSDADDLPCIVKMYDEAMEGIKVSQMIEVIGVLAHCPDNAVAADDTDVADDFMRLEIAARRPPSSLVPRIHCLAFRTGPALGLAVSTRASKTLTTPSPVQARAALLNRIANALGGDRLAAEYALMWMLSSTSRVGPASASRAVGKLSLAIALVPENSDMPSTLHAVVANLLPRSQQLRLAVDELSSKSLFPKKDYETNRLCAGQLQLCDGTPIIVDETALQAGTLNDQGVRNMQALQQLVEQQKLHYDFQYFACDWDVDTPVLVATSNRAPIVQGADCVVPFLRERKSAASSQHGPDSNATLVSDHDLRAYVAGVRARVADPDASFAVSEALAKQIEQSYVAARQRDGKKVQAETLDLWLTLAKLWEKSHGRDELTEDGWKTVLALENERLAMLPK